MSPDWLLISCIASALVALGLAFILGACWLAGEADEREAELRKRSEQDAITAALWGDPHRDNFS